MNSLEIYVTAQNLASKNNQTVGEKNDLYITIEQLEKILHADGRSYEN